LRTIGLERNIYASETKQNACIEATLFIENFVTKPMSFYSLSFIGRASPNLRFVNWFTIILIQETNGIFC